MLIKARSASICALVSRAPRRVTVLLAFSVCFGCLRKATTAKVDQFEASSDICADLNSAVAKYTAAPVDGVTPSDYSARLVQSERETLQRLVDLYSGSAADGTQAPLAENSDTAAASAGATDSGVGSGIASNADAGLATAATVTSSDVTSAAANGGGTTTPDAGGDQPLTAASASSLLALYSANLAKLGSCSLPSSGSSVAPSDVPVMAAAPPAPLASPAATVQAAVAVGARGTAALCAALRDGGAPADCKVDAIISVCGAVIGSAATVSADIGVASTSVAVDASTGVTRAFTSAAIACLQAMAPVTAAQAEAKITKVTASLTLSVAKALGSAACTQGVQLIANAIDNTKDVDFQNACAFKMGKSEWASCLRSSQLACDLALNRGFVDVTNAIGDDPSTNWDDVARVIASGSLTAACRLGGAVSSVSCTVINHAASQIRQAWLTGNNDWGHCAHSDQMGVCVNHLWRQWSTGVIDSDATVGISEPVDPGNGGPIARKCCVCDRQTYAPHWYGDKRLDKALYMETAYQGAAGDRACAAKTSTKFTPAGTTNYYWYSSCELALVSGGACPVPGPTPVSVQILTGSRQGTVSVP